MIRILIAIASVAASTPAMAGPVLWNNLELGMTKAEVTAKYPDSSVVLTSDCGAKLEPRFRDERLYAVVLRIRPLPKDGLGGRRRCSDTVFANLLSKYGEPTSSQDVKGSSLAIASKETIWNNGNLIVRHSFGLGNQATLLYLWSPTVSTPDITSKL